MSDAYKNCLLLFKIYAYNKKFVYVRTRIRTAGKNIFVDEKIICRLTLLISYLEMTCCIFVRDSALFKMYG